MSLSQALDRYRQIQTAPQGEACRPGRPSPLDEAKVKIMRELAAEELQRLPLGTIRALIRAFSLMNADPDPRAWSAWLASVFPCPQDARALQKIRAEALAAFGIE